MNGTAKNEQRDLPEFLIFLDQKLNYRVRLGRREALNFHIYNVDFAAWKLRFSDHTPVIYVGHKDAQQLSVSDLGQSLADVIRIQNLLERNPVILIDGEGEELRHYFRTRVLPLIVLDETDQQLIRSSRRPTGDLLDRVSVQLELFRLSPYETSKPVIGSRFFGRQYDIRRILYGSDTNFAVMGIRRIGKTSLLLEIQRQLREQALDSGDKQAGERILYMDCSAIRSAEHFIQEVVRKLSPRELVRLQHRQYPIYFPDFLERMTKTYGGPLIFLLDEFDAMLEVLLNDVDLLDKLRASSNTGHCRFVIAGFRRLLQAFHNQNSPLYNFAKALRLKEFRRDEAASLIVEPMENMRIRFERRNEIIDTIYDETAGQPNLVQYYCSILVEQLDRTGERTISPDNLFNIYEDEDFRAFVLNTFMDNTNDLEKAVVYAMITDCEGDAPFAHDRRFDLEEIDNALRAHQIEVFSADLEESCRNLELAGTFAKQGQHYHFATPVFPRLLRQNHNVDFLFHKLLQEGVW